MKFRHLAVLLGLMLLVSPTFAQGIIHNETIDGELSDTGPAPTSLGVLELGLSTIEGSLGGVSDGSGGATNGNDADIFTFTVAAGQTVNAITTTRSDDNLGFIGYVNAATLPSITDGDSLGAAVDSGNLFGTGPIEEAAGGLDPIPTSLGAGDHTFFLQETVDPVNFSISFNVVAAVPEPSSAALLGGLALLGCARRRRR